MFSCTSTAHIQPPYKAKFSRAELVDFASQFIGTPYQRDGKHPATGFDCSGFVAYVYNHFGKRLKGGSRDFAAKGYYKNEDNLKKGDLVFFGENDEITHVGIVTRRTKRGIEMIHSSSSYGITRDVFNHSNYWYNKFLYGKDVLSK